MVGLDKQVEKVLEMSEKLVNAKAKLYANKCDITDEKTVKRVFDEIQKIGPVHILINNACIMKSNK